MTEDLISIFVRWTNVPTHGAQWAGSCGRIYGQPNKFSILLHIHILINSSAGLCEHINPASFPARMYL